MTHKVVVYDPMTHALLEGGFLLPIMAAAAAFIALSYLVGMVLEKILPWNKCKAKWVAIPQWGIPAIGAFYAFNHFII